jgi:hypothetical protein
MPLSPAMDPAAPGAGIRLTERIRNWAKWSQFMKLEGPSAQPLVSLNVEALTPRPDERILSGDRLRVTITNVSQRPLFVALLDLSRTGSVGVVPLTVEGSSEQVAPRRRIIREIEAYVPERQTSATDFLKVFASVEPIDFRMLTMGNIREAPAKDPLTSCLRLL